MYNTCVCVCVCGGSKTQKDFQGGRFFSPVEMSKGSLTAQEPSHQDEAGEAQPPSWAPAGMSSASLESNMCLFAP